MTYYADLLWLMNFGADVLIMFTAARLLKLRVSFPRIASGSALSALTAVFFIIFLPSLHANLTSLASLIPAIFIAFKPQSPGDFAKDIFFTLMITFLLGGFIFSAILRKNSIYGTKTVFLYSLLFLCLMLFGKRLLTAYISDRSLCCGVKVHFLGKTVCGTGFFDTGNLLKDPLTGRSVVAADFRSLEMLFRGNLNTLSSPQDIEELFSAPELITKLRIIPYSAFGEKQKFLTGFLSDFIEITLENGQKKVIENAVIGVTTENFSLSSGSGFIINPEILK